MKTTKRNLNLKTLTIISYLLIVTFRGVGQEVKEILYDAYHGQNSKIVATFNKLLPDPSFKINVSEFEISNNLLKGKYGLILFSPSKALKDSEKNAVILFLESGGSLFLIMDEERRTPLHGINKIIKPFGIELTETIPYVHNCGAIAEKSKVCTERRELPYSGGRSIKGGKVISRVFMDGDYIHCAYTKTKKRGKIIVMSDGMAGLLMGSAEGTRLTGTKPSDTNYWGKDSEVFITELLEFFTEQQ